MAKYSLAGFDEIDLDNLEEYYESEGRINGHTIEIDLNFDEASIDEGRLEKVQNWIANLSELNRIGIAAIAEDFKSGKTVKEYIRFHLEELDESDLKALLKGANKKMLTDQQVLSVLKLKAVIFNPHSTERFITLDYTIDEDLTDQLIVIDLLIDGQVEYVTIES